jgi:hypothetical protein
MPEEPRAPEDHDLSGTGTPRSDDRGSHAPGTESGDPVDPAVVTGAGGTSNPAGADGLNINRSGSGGSGGAAAGDAAADPGTEEGSRSESMSELLGGEEDSEPGTR